MADSRARIFGDSRTEEKVRKIFEYRHIVIHRAGLIDPKFKRTTQYRGAIDRQIRISRRYVLESITTLQRLANRVESAIPLNHSFSPATLRTRRRKCWLNARELVRKADC